MVYCGVVIQFVDEFKENEEYIQIVINYLEYGFKYNFVFCFFFDFFKLIVVQFFLILWGVDVVFCKVRKMFIFFIQKCCVFEKDFDYKKLEDFLQYFMDGGIVEGDSDEIIVQRLMVMYFGFGLFIIIVVVQFLFDFCVYSEYVEVLREEII